MAQQLWDSLPGVYRQCAVSYTDEAYSMIFPRKRHRAVAKSGQTNHIERFNCTLRQRISRLVWLGKRCLFPKNLKTIWGRLATSFITTVLLCFFEL